MKRAHMMAPLLCACLCGLAAVGRGQESSAKEVKVVERDSLGQMAERETVHSTDALFTSILAPFYGGYRFLYWDISSGDQPSFRQRDAWGRAFDQVAFRPTQDVTLTATYAEASEEAQRIYWCNQEEALLDGDGYDFAQEMKYGLNPLFPDCLEVGGVAHAMGAAVFYNPDKIPPYTKRSLSPEGVLFPTEVGCVEKGTVITTPAYSPTESLFAYWDINGVRQADAWGVAWPSAQAVQGDVALTFTAQCAADKATRLNLYWFGTEEEQGDGDDYTLAQELQYALRPAFRDGLQVGGITHRLSALATYNPEHLHAYSIISDAEPPLFEAEEGYAKRGVEIATPTCSPTESTFAYWTLNGVQQRDAWGVAYPGLAVTMGEEDLAFVAHSLTDEAERLRHYWQGDAAADDGDGYTLEQEVQYAMHPGFTNELRPGGIAHSLSKVLEINLQPFDRATTLLIDGRLTPFFGQAPTEAAPLAPAVLPREGGLFDFLTYCGGTLTRYRNNGTVGNPNFTVETCEHVLPQMTAPVLCGAGNTFYACDAGGAILNADGTPTGKSGFPVWDGQTLGTYKDGLLALGERTFMLPDLPDAAVTAVAYAEATGDGLADLLVADALGRISLYERVGDGFELRHRVWGGSFEGFAQGLTLAPIDWDGDGDLDMLCGTAEGKLLLLSDPKVGKPSNLRAAAGIDNVLLAWDPNGQSRVCGYNVYRAATTTDFAHLGDTPLPSYRDQNLTPAEWAYRVTALSRRWVAGNSEPKVFESDPSDIVKATVGNVTLSLPESVTVYEGQQVVVPLSVNNAQGVTGAMSFTFTYDAAALAPVSFAPSALAQALTFESAAANGTWTLTTSGTLAAGAGELLRLRFRALASGTVTLTGATLGPITATLEGNITTVTVKDAPKPPRLTLKAEDVEAPLGTDEVDVPLTLAHVASSGTMNWDTLTVSADFDPAQLALDSAPTINDAGKYTYRFKVLTRTNEAQVAEVTFSAAAKGTDGGLAAEVSPTAARVVIAPKASTAGTPSLILLKVVGAKGDGLIRDDDDDEDEFDVKIGGTVIVKVRATAKGTETFDWERFSLSAAWKPQGGLAQQGAPKLVSESTEGATALYAVTFKVLEPVYKGDRHDDDDDDDWDDRWEDDIDIVFTGAVADAPDIKVRKAECEFEIEGRLDPRRVPPWHAGDLDGDGYLTGNDYQIARNHMKAYHQTGNAKKDKPHDTDDARKVHASLLMVPGITDPLTLKDVTVTYKKYLCDVCGVPPGELNMGNNGGKK